MSVTSQPAAGASPLAASAVRAATLGLSDFVRASSDARAERADATAALVDMKVTGPARATLESALWPWRLRSWSSPMGRARRRRPGAVAIPIRPGA